MFVSASPTPSGVGLGDSAQMPRNQGRKYCMMFPSGWFFENLDRGFPGEIPSRGKILLVGRTNNPTKRASPRDGRLKVPPSLLSNPGHKFLEAEELGEQEKNWPRRKARHEDWAGPPGRDLDSYQVPRNREAAPLQGWRSVTGCSSSGLSPLTLSRRTCSSGESGYFFIKLMPKG